MIAPLIKLREEIVKNKLDAALISSIPNIIYLTDYSGFSKEEREANLLITEERQYVFTDARYTHDVKRLIQDFELIEISGKLSFGDALKKVIKKHKIKKLGFEGNNISFLEHQKLSEYLNDIYHLSTSNLRTRKASEEIFKIEAACKLGDKTFDFILKEIKLGVTEKELAAKIEIFIKQNLADISFSPIVAFGKNSAVPHHQVTNNQLTNNQIVLLDFGVKLNNYCSDMTRTIFFGKAPEQFKKIYNTVLESQSLAIENLKSLILNHKSIGTKDLDKVARDYIISKDYPSIPHSLGHGIGLEVHEAPSLSPNSKDILKENMVFSVEPGIYISNFGGVRIEDLVVLEKLGPRLLTHSPKQIIEL